MTILHTNFQQESGYNLAATRPKTAPLWNW